MGFFVKSLIFALVGAIFGDVVSLLLAPSFAAWWQSTDDPNAMCNCVSTARNVASHLIEAQAIGSGAGAVLFLVLFFVFAHGRRKRAQAQQTAARPPAAT